MRHILRASCAGVLLAGTAIGPASAATLDQIYSSFVVFGDSLSDPGNLFALTGQPGAPYFDGRFSNGPVWAEAISAEFAVGGNFAFGGARAVSTLADPTDPSSGTFPDLAEQVDAFEASSLAGALGSRPLAAVWIGTNDLFNSLPDGPADVGATILAASQAISRQLGELSQAGFDDFLLFNLPDLGQTPLYETVIGSVIPSAPAGTTQATLAFNAALGSVAADLANSGADVTLIDANSLFGNLLADPGAFGLSDVDTPCFFGSSDPTIDAISRGIAALQGEDVLCDLATEAPERAFFDLVHPNATVHGVLTAEVRAALETGPAPVPLPAGLPLLLGAVAVLGLARRRVAG